MNEYIVASPQHSEILSEDNDLSSQKETALLNDSNCIKSNNFISAYVPVQKQNKHIVRGRKTFAFWTLVCLLFLLAIGNLLLTMTILGVLKLGNGMQSLELLTKENSIKLFGDVDLDRIYKQNGVLEGYKEENVEISSEEGSVLLNLYSRLNRMTNKVKIEKNETVFNGYGSFEVKNKLKETIFNVNSPVYNNLKNVNNFKSKDVGTNKIRSGLDEDLRIEGDNVHLKGNEGARLEAREIVWSADQDIYLKSINGSIVLSGKEGTYLDVERIPIAKLDRTNYVTAQFKICVCMPQGKLFRVPVANANDPVYCHQVDMSAQYNPSREIVWSADQDIYLKSINGSIVLSGKEGTYLDVERIPIAKLDRTNYVTAQFKICVCMPQGKLFRVPVANANDPVYCHQVDMSAQYNPCM